MTAPSSAIGEFIIGQSPIQGAPVSSTPVTLQTFPPSYLYQEYADDFDLWSFVNAYNQLAQVFVDWFNQVNLPIYTGLSGPLLDWVAQGLYGISRPALSSGTSRQIGPLNTWEFNSLPFNVRKTLSASNYVQTSDDIFKRIITWNFYKGDGNVFTVSWLKRRVLRFLLGTDGTAPALDQAYGIGVSFPETGQVMIHVMDPTAYDANVLKALVEGINSWVLQLPFQFQFVVAGVDEAGFGEFVFGESAFGGGTL